MNAKELVEAAKNRQNISQARLAKDLGISGASLSELAAGKKERSDETYIKLAKLAGVDPAEVIIEKHMRKADQQDHAHHHREQTYPPRTPTAE